MSEDTAEIVPFPEPVAQPRDMDDFDLLRYFYYEVGGFDHYPTQSQARLRSMYWQLYDRLLTTKKK